MASDFTDFDGGTGTVMPLVAPQGTNNPSSNTAMIVRDGGQVWAGSYLNLDGTLDFSNDNLIKLNLWTEAPVGTVVRMKLEQQSNPGNFAERDFTTTKTAEWESIFWDFGSLNNTAFDRLVFMFDFGRTGDGSNTSTFFFDDVEQTSTLSIGAEIGERGIKIYPNPVAQTLKIDAGNLELDRVEVYNLFGQLVLDRSNNLKSINMQSLESGMYLLKLYSGENVVTKKVVKE